MTKGGHRIGLVLDCGIEDDLRIRHVQVGVSAAADAAEIDVKLTTSSVVFV